MQMISETPLLAKAAFTAFAQKFWVKEFLEFSSFFYYSIMLRCS